MSVSRSPLFPSYLGTMGQDKILTSHLPPAKSVSAEVPDSVLRVLETQALHALETLSLSDSLLSGLGKLLFPQQPEGQGADALPELGYFEDEVSKETLFLTLSSLGRCSANLADSLSRVYANSVLLRRDAVLSKSLIPGEAQPRFRALPLHVSDLFGPQVKDLFREVSESARDSAFL